MRAIIVGLCWGMFLGEVSPAQSTSQVPADVYPGLQQDGRLLPFALPYLGQDLKPLVLPVDQELIQRRKNFGYSDEDIQKYFSQPVSLTLDETGLDHSLIKPPPAPGIHPRILFNPEDVPVIRDRLAKTQTGQAVMADIRAHLTKVLTGDQAKYRAEYDRLAAGDQTVDISTGEQDNVPYTLMYEAFRCLMDDDAVNGQKVAAALTTMAQMDEKRLEANIAKEMAKGDKGSPNDWRIVGQAPTQEGTLGLDYDFAYKWMTDEQRAIVRKTIVTGYSHLLGTYFHFLVTGDSAGDLDNLTE